MKKIILLPGLFLLLSVCLNAQNKVSNKSSDWSDPTAWTPSGVPTATNNVTISNGNTITMDVNAVCNALIVGTGGTASTLRFSGNIARTLSVTGNLTINSNGTLRTRNSSNVTHTINIKGNITNNGTLNLARDAGSLVDLLFTGNGSQSFSGTGATTTLNKVLLNMGTSVNNILDVSCSVFTVTDDFLKLSNGTFKLSTPNALTIVPFTTAPSIPATAGLWLNSANAVLSSSAGINLSGKLTVSAGTLKIGDAANEDLSVTGGTVLISAGTLSISGKYYASGSASTFSIGGGTLIVPTVNSTHTGIAPFQISAAGSQFNMTGGTIIIPREGGNGAQDLGFVNTGSTSGVISGGTLQIGNAASPAGQVIGINSTYSVASLVVSSANVSARLLSNALAVSNNISVTQGTLNANNLGISLGGNWSNAGIFTPGTGTVTFASASAQSIFKSGGETFNHLYFSGTGLKTFASAVTTSGIFSVSPGASVDVSASNYQLTLKSNFFNNGTFNARSGLLLLNGTTQQTLGGNSTTNFYDITLNNTTGALLQNAENLLGTLTLSNGTFNTNLKVFTMISTASGTARIAAITGTGDLSGNVTVQRYAPGGTTGWALLGTPVSSALSLNDWDDDIYISCPTCPDGSASGFLSIYTYSESVAGVYDAPASYVPLSTINDAITPGKGYWVYLGSNQFTTSAITLDVTGSIRKFNYNIPLSYTNYGTTEHDGWNLIHNPYPSAISWAALKGTTSNIDNAIYTYNADLNSGTGGYASYVNGVSSPAVAAGGINDIIPMCQGFYVHSTGATVLNAKETNKVAGNPTFLKANSTNVTPLLRINFTGTNAYTDETVLYFQQNASDGFDLDFDAYKMRGQDPLAPALSFVKGADELQINGIPPVSGTFTTDLKTITGYSGSYTLALTDFATFPKGACISLFDKVTSTSTDLRTTDYTFYLQDTTIASRFILSITLNPLALTHSVTASTCQSPQSGMIIASGANSGPWNYYWKTNGSIIKTSLNKAGADSLTNLNGGNFELEMNTAGLCDNGETSFYLAPKIIPSAQFNSKDTLFLNQSDSLQFINTSVNAASSTWFFENPTYSTTALSPVMHYTSPGNYTINLVCESNTGCFSSFSKNLSVLLDVTGVSGQQALSEGLIVKTIRSNAFVFEQHFDASKHVELKLYAITGELVYDHGILNGSEFSVPVDLKNNPPGIYFMKITYDQKQVVVKIISH